MELVPSSGKDLVAVGLMPYIPHQQVFGSVENIMQGDGKFHDPQAGPKMALFGSYYINNEFPEFGGKIIEIFLRKFPKILRGIYSG